MGRYGSEKRYLGIVRSVAPMGLIVVSMDRRKPIPLGSKVYFRDDSGTYRELGVVVDVIGNVERPHAVVRVHERSSLNEIPIGLDVLYELRSPRSHRGAVRRGR
jgi:rRNA processing protein Gar1